MTSHVEHPEVAAKRAWRSRWMTRGVVGILAIVFFALFVIEARIRNLASPSRLDLTLGGYLDHRGVPPRIRVTESGSVLCIGGIKNGYLPSGPTVYVYDPAGRLVDWSADSGDDYQFGERWPNFWNIGTEVSESEFRTRAGSRPAAP